MFTYFFKTCYRIRIQIDCFLCSSRNIYDSEKFLNAQNSARLWIAGNIKLAKYAGLKYKGKFDQYVVRGIILNSSASCAIRKL